MSLIEYIKRLKEIGFDEARGNKISNEGANLRLNYLWNEETIELAEFLKTDITITKLELEESLMELDGAKAIIQALQKNYTITDCSIFLADNYTAIVGAESLYEDIVFEEIDKTDKIIYRNRKFVKKLSLFLINDFSIEDKEANLNIQNLKALKFYKIADKKLLTDYLKEYEDVMDIFALLTAAGNFINKNSFALAGICKLVRPNNELKQGEIHISHLPSEILLHIVNFIEPNTLGIKYSKSTLENTEVENIGVTEISNATENSYCNLL